MNMSISNGAAAAREQARRQDGKFGHQPHAEAEVDLGSAPDDKSWRQAWSEAFTMTASPERLRELSHHGNLRVRVAVANNPSTTADVLENMAGDENGEVRFLVAAHPRTSPKVLHDLAQDEYPDIRQQIAKSKRLNNSTFEMLAQDPDKRVRGELAQNQNTPKHLLTRLAKDEERWVVNFAATNPHTPPAALLELADSEDAEMQRVIALSSVNPRVLTTLASSSNPFTRAAVAVNPKTPTATAFILASDEDPAVRWSLAEETKDAKILELLAEDNEPRIRQAVATNRHAGAGALAKLADHPELRDSVSWHPNTTPEILEKMGYAL